MGWMDGLMFDGRLVCRMISFMYGVYTLLTDVILVRSQNFMHTRFLFRFCKAGGTKNASALLIGGLALLLCNSTNYPTDLYGSNIDAFDAERRIEAPNPTARVPPIDNRSIRSGTAVKWLVI